MKKIFDMNVHLIYSKPYLDSLGNQTSRAADSLKSENEMNVEDYIKCLSIFEEEFQKNFHSANFMFFNSNLFREQSFKSLIEKISKEYSLAGFTALINYKENDFKSTLDNLVNAGFTGIKFHPYSQEIIEADWIKILEISKEAERRNLLIYVCTSFGTSRMHKHNGMGLACSLAENITKTPIILLHSGGTKIYEAMLLADDKPNVFLETSFSLNYLENSPLWDDIAYVFKKVGTDRVLYGSDFPYVSFSESFNCINTFFRKFQFSDSETSNILFANSERLIRNR